MRPSAVPCYRPSRMREVVMLDIACGLSDKLSSKAVENDHVGIDVVKTKVIEG